MKEFYEWLTRQITAKGGEGSGFSREAGHVGRPGKVGGSRRGSVEEVAYSLLNKTGGYTISFSGEVPETGFMVSIYLDRGVSIPLEDASVDFIEDYIEKNKDIAYKKDHYMGGWVHEGRFFIDVSVNVDTSEEARRLSIEHKQIAYWDVVKKEEVIVDPNAKGASEMKNFEPEEKKEEKREVPKIYFKADATREQLEELLRIMKGEDKE